MLLIGGISFHLVVCGALLVTTEKTTPRLNNYRHHMIPQDEHAQADEARQRCSTLWKYAFKNFDLELLRNYRYWLAALTTCGTIASHDMWIIFFVSMAQSKGFSAKDAAIFVTIAGVGNLIAKLTHGVVIDRLFKSYWVLMSIYICISSAMFYTTPWLTGYWTMMMSSFLTMFCFGAQVCMHDVLYKQVLGVDLLAGVYGWLGLKMAIISFCLDFLPGICYSSNHTTFYILSLLVETLSLGSTLRLTGHYQNRI